MRFQPIDTSARPSDRPAPAGASPRRGRRFFIATGAGALTLTAVGATLAWRASAGQERRAILRALVPVFVGLDEPPAGAPPNPAIEACVQALEAAIAGLSPSAQAELADLLRLIAFAPTRLALTGRLRAWPDLSGVQLARVLAGWRTHALSDLRAAYQGLHDLVLGTWYASPANWSAIGYPGPVRLGAEGSR